MSSSHSVIFVLHLTF